MKERCSNSAWSDTRVALAFYKDGESAKEPGRRPGFDEMLAALRRDPTIHGVICHKVDRLLRNFPEYVVIDEYMRAGVDFQFLSGNFERNAIGNMLLGLQVVLSKHYSDNFSEDVKKGLHRRGARRAPLGLRPTARLSL